MPIHLNTHSYYSLLNGIPKPGELAAAAAKQGHKAIALTDHNRLTGTIEFTLACQLEGVKPILGLEVNLATQKSPLPALLLAMDTQGWGNLCKLSSWLLHEGHGEERTLPSEKLLAYHKGLIAIVSARVDMSLLDLLRSAFANNLYLQLTPHNGNFVVDLSKRTGIPSTAIWPIYYMRSEQAELQTLLTAIRYNITLDRLQELTQAPANSYFPSNEELQTALAKYPQATQTTEEIAERCNFDLPLGKPIFPELDLPQGQTPISALREKAYNGARKHYGGLTQDITNRLEHELETIDATGYATLFLIMEEVVAFARQADVPISSRG